MNENRLFNNISEVGCLLLKHGAEIYRVEESLIKMVKSYGYKQVEVFAVPSFFTMSITLDNHVAYTISKRSRQNKINLDCIYALNNLVRNICEQNLSIEVIEQELIKINNIEVKMKLIFIGYGLAAGFFTIFFGGSLVDGIIGALIGFITYFTIWLMEKLEVNNIVTTLLASSVMSASAIILYKVGIIINQQATIIGCLMVLVPGVAITNSLRDIIGGEYISGLARMAEAFLIAASIAIGVGCMIMVLGG